MRTFSIRFSIPFSIRMALLAVVWLAPVGARAGSPAARVGDYHVCPMLAGTTPHVGGPIIAGDPVVLVCGSPAARIGDVASCVGAPDSLAAGSATVLISGKPAVRAGDATAHGGSVTVGCATVLIGD